MASKAAKKLKTIPFLIIQQKLFLYVDCFRIFEIRIINEYFLGIMTNNILIL